MNENKSQPCELIRDLMPLCHDGIASNASREAVETHVQECGDCKAYWEKLCGGDQVADYMFDAELSRQAAASYAKVKKKTSLRNTILIAAAVIAGILLATFGPMLLGLLMMLMVFSNSEIEVHDNIAEYELYRSGEQAAENYQTKWMDESIFPESITPEMDVQDYKMVYYNPWDANYLGYLVVKYDDAAYAAECARLQAYPSTDYIGYYGVTGEEDYELLAVNADDYSGFVYAMTDGAGTIIYAEQMFCNYFMDIPYQDYIPEAYLLDGFDASDENPYWKAHQKK